MNILSIQRPRPSMLILIAAARSTSVNWLPLIGIEDLGLAEAGQRFLQGLDAWANR